jgi:hypothetical protein
LPFFAVEAQGFEKGGIGGFADGGYQEIAGDVQAFPGGHGTAAAR